MITVTSLGDMVRRAGPLLMAAVLLPTAPARAQLVWQQGGYGVTLEAFANLTAGSDVGSDESVRNAGGWGRLDGAFRLLGTVKGEEGFGIGPRVIVQTSPEDKVSIGERSLLLLTPWGRIEVGRRQGLPDVLVGYPPNSFTFTGAEFGPATGPGLDPDGRLPTLFLDHTLGEQIDALSTLGFAASFYLDQSSKVLYVTPKRNGFLGGLSYAPEVDDPGDRYKGLLQSGLVYELTTARHIVRFGGTYTFAQGRSETSRPLATTDLHSVSGGVVATFDDRLIVAASASYNGRSGLDRGPGLTRPSAGYGYAASLNYNVGPWTVGGYLQSASQEGDQTRAGSDRLRVVEVGGSYRLDTRLRIYGSAYLYSFRDEGGARSSDRHEGAVVLLGARVTL